MRIFIDRPYVQVRYDESNKILYSVWQGFATADEFLGIGERLIELVSKENIHKVLYNTLEIELIDDFSQAFISGAFTRKMIIAGIQYSATVLPKDDLALESLDHIRELTHAPDANNRFFSSLEEAEHWLFNQELV